MGTHLFLNVRFLLVGTVSLYALYYFTRFFAYHLLYLFVQRAGQVVHGLFHLLPVSIVGSLDGFFGINLIDSLIMLHFSDTCLLFVVTAYLLHLLVHFF